jgi:DNA-binding transcriptional LysR family regulator
MAFHERGLRIISELENAEAMINNLQDGPRGALKIRTSVAFSEIGAVLTDNLFRLQ